MHGNGSFEFTGLNDKMENKRMDNIKLMYYFWLFLEIY